MATTIYAYGVGRAKRDIILYALQRSIASAEKIIFVSLYREAAFDLKGKKAATEGADSFIIVFSDPENTKLIVKVIGAAVPEIKIL